MASDQETEYEAGRRYFEGLDNTRIDYEKALRHYLAAAKLGHGGAQNMVGYLHDNGLGVKEDKREAEKWFRKSALQGFAEAQYNLGDAYLNGYGVEKSIEEAILWFMKAAEQEFPPALQKLAEIRHMSGQFKGRERYKIPPQLLPLMDEISADMQRAGFLPEGEHPIIPELRQYSNELTLFICRCINSDMKTRGLDYDEMVKVFEFVFYRATDIGWQWHQSQDGNVRYVLTVEDPFNDDPLLTMPPDMLRDVKRLHVPEAICEKFMVWYDKHRKELNVQGIDIWEPLMMCLALTYNVAHSILLKVFGYRS